MPVFKDKMFGSHAKKSGLLSAKRGVMKIAAIDELKQSSFKEWFEVGLIKNYFSDRDFTIVKK